MALRLPEQDQGILFPLPINDMIDKESPVLAYDATDLLVFRSS